MDWSEYPSWARAIVYSAAESPVLPLLIVVAGGLLGGLLMKPFARFYEQFEATESLTAVQTALLGILAAGATVFVVANTDTDDKPHLFFLAALSGLVAPSVLLSASKNLTMSARKVKEFDALRDQSAGQGDPSDVAIATEEHIQALDENKLNLPALFEIDKKSAQIIDNIGSSGIRKPESIAEMVEQISKIGVAAKNKGLTGTVDKAKEKLREFALVDDLDAETAAIAQSSIDHF